MAKTALPPNPPRDESAVGELCARLFSEPNRLDQAVSHAVSGRLYIAPHAHKNLLQLDLITGCTGQCLVDGRWCRVHDLTAMTTYPGDEHGYELIPHDSHARVFNIRLHVASAWPAVTTHALQPWSTSLDPGRGLVPAVRLVTDNAEFRGEPSVLQVSRLAEVLCLWPRIGQGPGDMPAGFSIAAIKELDPELAGAIDHIHRSPQPPPTLEELADVAGMSARHFARRFETLLGCTPHTYVTARRFARAREMLLEERFKTHRIADSLGFSSPATFSRWFSQHAGVSPAQYRKDPHVL